MSVETWHGFDDTGARPHAEPTSTHPCCDCQRPGVPEADLRCTPCHLEWLRAEQEAERDGGSCLAGIRADLRDRRREALRDKACCLGVCALLLAAAWVWLAVGR